MSVDSAILIFILGTSVLLLFACTLVMFLITHKKKRFQHRLEKQQMESNYQNQLLLSRLEVQELSFKQFSEEIHDNIGQLLSIVKMQLHSIRNSSKEQDIIKQAAASTELLGKAITDLRNVSHTLNSVYVDNVGLSQAIQKDMDYISSARAIDCSLEKTGEEYDLDNDKELMVFRIVQEAITNAIKHAAPTAIKVLLNYTDRLLTVVISDNGNGFNKATVVASGIGLNNMHVRAGLLNGRLDVSSEEGKGTLVTLEIDNIQETKTE
jgi:two-component system NarL family sensor kinase